MGEIKIYEFIIILFLGWSGHLSTSWKATSTCSNSDTNRNSGPFDGQTQVLYWADACSEIAFVVPTELKPLEPQKESLTYNSSSLPSNFDIIWKI